MVSQCGAALVPEVFGNRNPLFQESKESAIIEWSCIGKVGTKARPVNAGQ
jgi:hypothetical protein